MKFAKTFIALSTMLFAFAAAHADEEKGPEAAGQEQTAGTEGQVVDASKGCGCDKSLTDAADALKASSEL